MAFFLACPEYCNLLGERMTEDILLPGSWRLLQRQLLQFSLEKKMGLLVDYQSSWVTRSQRQRVGIIHFAP